MQHNVVKNGNETLHVVTRFQEQKSNYWTVGLLSGDFPSNCRGRGRKRLFTVVAVMILQAQEQTAVDKECGGKTSTCLCSVMQPTGGAQCVLIIVYHSRTVFAQRGQRCSELSFMAPKNKTKNQLYRSNMNWTQQFILLSLLKMH